MCDDKKTLKLKKKNLKKQKVLLGLGVQREMVFGGGYRKEEKKITVESFTSRHLPDCWYQFLFSVQPFAENSVPCSSHTFGFALIHIC